MHLDLGCGPFPRDGYEGVDLVPGPGVTHVVDLEKFPWKIQRPYPASALRIDNDSVEGVFTSHLVEHITDLVGFMRELHRVCKAGAEVIIHHPYQFNVRAWQDPTHVRALNEASWFYYDKNWRASTGNTWGGYGDCDFELVELDAIPEENWKEIANEFPEEFERACRNQVNVISDLRVLLRCRKNA
jgi:SAM-dependent methyltransferase